LAAHERTGGLIEAPVLARLGGFEPEPIPRMEGRRIGSYQILREIGRGGMGAVYLASRVDDVFRKQVAIKILPASLGSAEVIRRFRQEREILASLDHPNITRLIDGGSTDEGLPYFVMEYVEGQPIDQYCDQRKLSVSDRLRLFGNVCAAVQYAHQNLIVHRDLKPRNILVTSDGTAKLLDFGIAKLLRADSDQNSVAVTETRSGIRVMTPEYASPEQVKGEPITTASDTYSLGVVLYELLTRRRPYRIGSHILHEVVRAICEEEPTRPSTAISQAMERSATGAGTADSLTPERIGEVCEGNTARLKRRLKGDLDNILLKSLRKEPNRRYSSVEQFSEDIRRHLEGLPVGARKDTFSYRAGKFLRRNKWPVAAVALLALSLVTGIASLYWQASMARAQARDQSRLQVLFDMWQEDLNRFPQNASFQNRILKIFTDIGFRLENRGDLEGAKEWHDKALKIAEAAAAVDPSNPERQNALAKALAALSIWWEWKGDPAKTIDLNKRALQILDRLLEATPNDSDLRGRTIALLLDTGLSADSIGDRSSALTFYRKAQESSEAWRKDAPGELRSGLIISNTLGVVGGKYLLFAEDNKTSAADRLRFLQAACSCLAASQEQYQGMKRRGLPVPERPKGTGSLYQDLPDRLRQCSDMLQKMSRQQR
jgi:serine/threonine protein kinase